MMILIIEVLQFLAIVVIGYLILRKLYTLTKHLEVSHQQIISDLRKLTSKLE